MPDSTMSGHSRACPEAGIRAKGKGFLTQVAVRAPGCVLRNSASSRPLFITRIPSLLLTCSANLCVAMNATSRARMRTSCCAKAGIAEGGLVYGLYAYLSYAAIVERSSHPRISFWMALIGFHAAVHSSVT